MKNFGAIREISGQLGEKPSNIKEFLLIPVKFTLQFVEKTHQHQLK